jgi:CcmD family protein
MKKKLFSVLSLIFLMALPAAAQGGLEEYFYQSGKIKVVVAVAMVVLAGIFVFLFYLDKKVSRIEKKITQDKSTKG